MTAVKMKTPEIEFFPVDHVIPFKGNHKIHDEASVQEMAQSIETQGLIDPISIDKDGIIISGHRRHSACKLLGWVEVPVRVWRELSEVQVAAMRITANKVVGDKYDKDALKAEIESIASLDASAILGTGFKSQDLTKILGKKSSALEGLTLALGDTTPMVMPGVTKKRKSEKKKEYVVVSTQTFESKKAADEFAEKLMKFSTDLEVIVK